MKISAEFDTKDKSLKVMRDGQEVPNVAGAHFSPSYDDSGKFQASVHQRTSDKDEGIEEWHSLSAAEGVTVIQADSKIDQDVARFFGVGG